MVAQQKKLVKRFIAIVSISETVTNDFPIA